MDSILSVTAATCWQMRRRVAFEFELPNELLAGLGVKEVETMAKEALVMEFLREHRLSQGIAADLLGVDRHQLFELYVPLPCSRY